MISLKYFVTLTKWRFGERNPLESASVNKINKKIIKLVAFLTDRSTDRS